MIKKKWTEAEIDTLKFYISNKFTAQEIADEMGRTRNSILNKSLKTGISFVNDLKKNDKFNNFGDFLVWYV